MSEENKDNLRPFGANTPYELATTGNPDPRSENDLVTDWVDPRIIDIIQQAGLIGADDNKTFSRNFVLDLARIAYGRGAKDGSDDPEGMKRYMSSEFSAEKKKMHQSQIEATQADISSLPETPPETPNN